MQLRPLGRIGVEVSPLSLGAMELRGPPRGRDLSETEVARLLNAALDGGINVIDTSIDYELSEERIGRHLNGRREEFFLATKCGCLVGWERPIDYAGGMAGGGPHDFSRENIVAGVEQSLRRLQTDFVDLIQLHASPDLETLERYDVVNTLNELKRSGKARFIGMSGVLPNINDHIAMGVFDVFQMPFSPVQMFHREAISDACDAGAGVLTRGGAGRGVATGSSRAMERSKELARVWAMAGIDDLLDGIDPMEFTLRYSLGVEGVSSILVGTASIEHLRSNIAAVARGPLPEEIHLEAEKRLLAVQGFS